jgi:hypothetical protein
MIHISAFPADNPIAANAKPYKIEHPIRKVHSLQQDKASVCYEGVILFVLKVSKSFVMIILLENLFAETGETMKSYQSKTT